MLSFKEFMLLEKFEQGELYTITKDIPDVKIYDKEDLQNAVSRSLPKETNLEVVSSSNNEVVFKTSFGGYIVLSTSELKKLPIKAI